MHRILILFFALLMVSGVESATAARPSAYARAKMKGRVYTHRPSFKRYKGNKSTRNGWACSAKARSGKSSYSVGRHSTR